MQSSTGNQPTVKSRSGLVSPSAACWHACSLHLSVPCLPLPAAAQLINGYKHLTRLIIAAATNSHFYRLDIWILPQAEYKYESKN